MATNKDTLITDGPDKKDYLFTTINVVALLAGLITIGSYFGTQFNSSTATAAVPVPAPAVTPTVSPVVVPVPVNQESQQKAFILESTDYDAKVSGYVATVTVKQRFLNPNKNKIDATYSFPLSDSGAIEAMTMKIGDRVIKGQIKEAQEAKRIYQQARLNGRAASLLQQVRTNIFTESVANIEPGKPVDVTITYTELLPFTGGKYSLVIPTAIGPRFVPDDSQGYAAAAADNNAKHSPVQVHVALNEGGLPISNIASPLHHLQVQNLDRSHANIACSNSNDSDGKDIIINWAVVSNELQSSYLAHREGKTGFLTAMIMPPQAVSKAQAAPKEMLFVIDCSGSQSGAPIQKAKDTLDYIVENMNPDDTFQIIAFNSNINKNTDVPVAATPKTKAEAHKFIQALEADGGTMMAPAIEEVCSKPAAKHRLRIVTLMTDGFIDNDYNILAMVKKLRGNSRWFPFGTGNNVNRTLIDGIAKEGGGEPEYVLLDSASDKVAKHFYDRIASPVLTNVSVSFEGVKVKHVYPKAASDVWEQRPLYFQAAYDQPGSGTMIIKGFSQGKPYQQRLPIVLPALEEGNGSLGQVWARERINELMALDWQGMQNGNTSPDVKQDIINTSLENHVLSQFTSFVAVDTALADKQAQEPPTKTDEETASANASTADSFSSPPPPPAASLSSNFSNSNTAAPSPGSHYTGSQLRSMEAYPAPISNYLASQTQQVGSYAPTLQGATCGSIGPMASDATVISGINTSGIVRVNNLANLEAALNIFATTCEVIGLIWGIPTLLGGLLLKMKNNPKARRKILAGAAAAVAGLSMPQWINWLVGAARDANLFN